MKKLLSLITSLALLLVCVSASAEMFSTEGYVFHKVDEPTTFSIAVLHDFLVDPSTEDQFIVQMSEATNIHFNFEVISNADRETRINLLLASGEYPDAMTGSVLNASQIYSLGEAGILVDLKPYMTAEYMPNLTKLIEDYYPNLLVALEQENGAIYTLPTAMTNWYDTWGTVHINTEWLAKVGKEMPTSLDEFADVLVAFKENDCNGNGEADEIPLGYCPSYWTNPSGIAGWFGTSKSMMYIDGKAIFGPTEDNFRDYISYLNRLWNLGVMDIETFTQDSNTFNSKGMLPTAVYGAVNESAKDWWCNVNTQDQYTLVPPINGGSSRYGALKQRVTKQDSNLTQAVIFNNGQDIATLLKWFDNLYDPFYGQIASKGFLNGILEVTDDHKIIFAPDENVPSQYANHTDWMAKTHIQQWPASRIEYYDEYFATTGVVKQLKDASDFLAPYFYNEVMPYGFAFSSEQSVYDEYLTDISKYVNEKFAAWVTGEADIGAEWDAFQDQLKTLHVEELVAAYQAQYDRLTGKK